MLQSKYWTSKVNDTTSANGNSLRPINNATIANAPVIA